MKDDREQRVRDAVMDTFRAWGGQWNVTARQPESETSPEARWLLRVHCRPIVKGHVTASTVDDYLSRPSDAEARSRWESELRSIFEEALATE